MRNPLVPALLSLVTLGLGDAYNGFPRKGLTLVATGLGLMLTTSAVFMVASESSGFVPPPWLIQAFWPGPYVLYAVGAVRAWRDARRLRDVPRPDHTLRRCLTYVVVVLAITVVARTFVVQAFKMPSGAMEPTLQVGDHVLVEKFLFGARLELPFSQRSLGRLPAVRTPRPGDVIVFIPPQDRALDFVKRVVAVEGQTIEVRGHRVYIDGQLSDPGDVHLHAPPLPAPRPPAPCGHLPTGASAADCGPFAVPPGTVFVMGDNRERSFDSRFWGAVPIADVKGRAFVVYRSGSWERVGQLIR